MQTAQLSTYSDLELALMILLGYFGNGQARVKALGSRYSAAQSVVEEILLTGKIPSGSGTVSADRISKAVHSVFDKDIDAITEELLNELD